MKIKELIKKTFLYDLLNEYKYEKELKKNPELFEKFRKLTILDDYKTVDEIVLKGKSFTRYGDGEFRWMLNDDLTPNFQKNDPELSKRLKEILLDYNNDRILIGISKNLQDVSTAVSYDKFFWAMIINDFGEKFVDYLHLDATYGNASLTRFYIGYKDKKNAINRVNNLKRIWNNRKILIVEGEYSRLGVGNDLFNNSLGIERLIAPSKDAFEKCYEIENFIKENVNKDTLIILALGPTATVLTYDLALNGFQAIDLGHADVEYEWFKKKTKRKVAIKGKMVNEVNSDSYLNDSVEDSEYNSQIIKKII